FKPTTLQGAEQVTATETTSTVEGMDVVTVKVENGGYFPNVVHAKANLPIRLRLVTNEVYSCAVAFVIPSMGVEQVLKPTGVASIDIPAQAKGTRIPFSCSMGMFTGELVID
ncbi:MAG: cupredoxin domain-containing protein, partial [Anaerolineaceae bacterium]|nr:cupredoxin domain-containing protein [Anaerolineaceae bacterium]